MPAPSCTDNQQSTIKWTGSGNATITAVAGAVYAPSDNSEVAGNSDPKGRLLGVVIGAALAVEARRRIAAALERVRQAVVPASLLEAAAALTRIRATRETG